MEKHILAVFDVTLIHTRSILQAIRSYQRTLKVSCCYL